jgi:RHS repeat-associated protein
VIEDLKFISDPVLFGRHVIEPNATNVVVRSYVWGLDLSESMDGANGVGGLLWVTLHTASGPAAGTHFVAYDGNGNIVALSGASDGSETARYEYGPFVEPIRVSGPVAALNPFRFSTKRTDPTTDLALYEYRVYKPSIGRWTNRDPLGEPGFELLRGKKPSFLAGGPNKHLFVQNNPVSIIDPLGLWQWGWPPWGNKKKDEKCCEKKDASPYKDLADKFLTDLAAKVQEAEAEIGRAKVADILDKLGKAKFVIDLIKSICDAKNPDGCDEFLKSGALVDCLLCCTSIHGLFSDELARLGFSITCKFACRHAD